VDPSGAARPDWYPDPTGRYEFRYFNGVSWTADVASRGQRSVDPLGHIGGPARPARRAGGAGPGTQDRLATASLVLGIVGICLSWVPIVFVAGGVCAVLAVVFALVARRREPRDTRGFIGVGLATGAGGLALVAVGVWTTVLVFDAIDRYEHPPAASADLTTCRADDHQVTIAGTIENRGRRASEFRVVVSVPRRAGAAVRVAIPVDEVEPGDTAAFTTVATIADALSREGDACRVVDITGPLPFGVAVDG